ncbi:hypothetical protein [Mesorhizobium sp. SARCC-RB16n]|uniref:hypothetical protein n=1 Tax=Mesorhizobium sp. SARCC-RB16n TaxID=2116687 RepID=UPI00358E81D4
MVESTVTERAFRYVVQVVRLVSIRQARIMMNDRIQDRFIDAAGVFLDLVTADSDHFGAG